MASADEKAKIDREGQCTRQAPSFCGSVMHIYFHPKHLNRVYCATAFIAGTVSFCVLDFFGATNTCCIAVY